VSETIQRIESYGIDDALVARVELERIADVVEYRHYGPDLVMDEQRSATPEETAAHEHWEYSQNVAELRAQGQKALDKNKAFLALDPPTNAQNGAQIEALTKQMNGLIRQVLQQWDDISDAVLEEAP
jgi:hypothetical protein